MRINTTKHAGLKGFTLVELLIVVLIIGILSSVALPQYQKAVSKARAVELWTSIDALSKGQRLYFLGNRRLASDLADLEVEVPTMRYFAGIGSGSGSGSSSGCSTGGITGPFVMGCDGARWGTQDKKGNLVHVYFSGITGKLVQVSCQGDAKQCKAYVSNCPGTTSTSGSYNICNYN